MKGHTLLPRELDGVPDLVRRRQAAQQPRRERLVRAVSAAGLGKGPVQRDVRRGQLLPENFQSEPADARRTRSM